MSSYCLRLVCVVISSLLLAVPATAEKLSVNGSLKKINDRAKIAVASNGNALVVWSNGNSKSNDKGVLYGREIIKTSDGFTLGELFQVSEKKGSNQHVDLDWINEIGAYVITWDTSFRDLNEFNDFDHIADRPLPGADVLARTYTPSTPGVSGATAEDRLGPIVTVNDPTIELNVLPHVTPLPGGDALISFLGSDESESTGANFTAGIWGARFKLQNSGVSPGRQELVRTNRRLMLNGFNFNSQAGLGVITDSFVAEGSVFAGGAYMQFNFDGDFFFPSGVGAVYKINPNTLNVDSVVSLDEFNPKGGDAPLKANGQIAPLNIAPDVAAPDFTIVGTSNIVKQITTLKSNFNAPMQQKHGLISDKNGDIIDQFLFRMEPQNSSPAASQSGVWILHHTSKGLFRYRAIGPDGSPSGGSKKAFKTKKGRLLYMDVAVSGKDVLVAWTERKTAKRTLVFFDHFRIE